MNKNLLKRIQADIGESAGNYCGCFNDYTSAAINEVYNGVPNAIDYESLPKDYCQKCQKRVNEFIEDFTRRMKLILPAYKNYKIQMPESAKETVESVLPGVLPGVLPVEAARRLGVTLNDINRHIRSGRLNLDASGKFVSLDSFNELQGLYRVRNGEN